MRYLVQIHLSESCNLRCKHCYQESSGKSPLLTPSDVDDILTQARMVATARGFDELAVNLTGGEPLLIPNIKEYIEVVLKKADKMLLLTNGTMIDEKMVDYFKEKSNIRIQVSIDGTKEVHDNIRGKGSFDKAIRGINLLSKAEIPCSVACTIHSDNYEMVDEIIKVADKAGADRIWFDRYVPCGNARPLTTEQFIVAMTLLAGERGRHKIEVGYNRALQFLFDSVGAYKCSALSKAITVLPDKTILPCRRMPIPIGNLKSESLAEIYEKNTSLLEILDNPPKQCQGCALANRCNGGLRCLSFATCGLEGKDPNCFLQEITNGYY